MREEDELLGEIEREIEKRISDEIDKAICITGTGGTPPPMFGTIAEAKADGRAVRPSHTPGPWVVNQERNQLFVMSSSCDFGNDPDCFYICRVANQGDVDEESANARLIAAAPDLLEACKLLLRLSLPSDVSGTAMVAKAREAITKATGE